MVLGLVSDGEASVFDMFSRAEFSPCTADSELGGRDDILEFGGREPRAHADQNRLQPLQFRLGAREVLHKSVDTLAEAVGEDVQLGPFLLEPRDVRVSLGQPGLEVRYLVLPPNRQRLRCSPLLTEYFHLLLVEDV